MSKPAFTAAMKNYFGFLPGQGVTQFAAELKALSYEEKVEFSNMLQGAGIDHEPPKNPNS